MSDVNAAISTFARGLSAAEHSEVIREVYKKHAAELLAIEEAQQKLVLLVIGIFGAGATFLASEKAGSTVSAWTSIGLTLLAVAILLIAGLYTRQRDRARISVRRLLLRSEFALGIFEDGVYLQNEPLYDMRYITFPSAGAWLSSSYWLAVFAGAAFVVVLWSLTLVVTPFLYFIGAAGLIAVVVVGSQFWERRQKEYHQP